MKRQTLVTGLLSLTAVTFMTGCVDDKYDLSDIDTTSRITVDDLKIPLRLSEMQLENVIDLDDNDLIEKVDIDGRLCYAIKQGGDIAPKEFEIAGIHVGSPYIKSTDFNINLPDLPVLPGVTVTDLPLGEKDIDTSDLKLESYSFEMEHIDKALLSLDNVKTTTIQVKVVLTLPDIIVGGDNQFSFTKLHLKLPWGLMNVKGVSSYNDSNGEVIIDRLNVDKSGKAVLTLQADGLDLFREGRVDMTDPDNHKLSIAGKVGVLGGKLDITFKNFTIPSSLSKLNIQVDYQVTSFDISSFTGDIDYNMDAIHIDPISLDDLPDFLDSPQTNIVIANPQILVGIDNPVGNYGPLVGEGKIILTSNFKNGEKISHESGIFQLRGERSDIAFCTPEVGYDEFVQFDGLRDVLAGGGDGLPSSIEVNIQDINFHGKAIDLPIGKPVGTAQGDYTFKAPLGFGDNSIVVYESTQDGWSDDDLDDLNISNISLSAKCSTNLPVRIHLEVFPLDKNGDQIDVVENSQDFIVPANAESVPVNLSIKPKDGGVITDLDGVKFKATVTQNSGNTEAIGPDLFIKLDDLRITVGGYYETDF